jgi:hypothetical protein
MATNKQDAEQHFSAPPSYFYANGKKIEINRVPIEQPPTTIAPDSSLADNNKLHSRYDYLERVNGELFTADNKEILFFPFFTVKSQEDHFVRRWQKILPDYIQDEFTVKELCFADNLYLIGAPSATIAIQTTNSLHESVLCASLSHLSLSYSVFKWSPQVLWSDTTIEASRWHLEQLGLDTSNTLMSTDLRGTTVAVIDQGFYGFPNQNPGHVNLTRSGFYKSDLSLVAGRDEIDEHKHGIACAELVVQASPRTKLVLLATQTTLTKAPPHVLALAIAYAANYNCEHKAKPSSGVDIIICAQQDTADDYAHVSEIVRLAVDYAARTGRGGRGVPVFWSGQDAKGTGVISSDPNVLAIGGTVDDGSLVYAKSTSPPDFMGPGKPITIPRISKTTDGTSFAAPLAAGLAARILAEFPKLTADQLRAILRLSCTPIADYSPNQHGYNRACGYGLLNYPKAKIYARKFTDKKETTVAAVNRMVKRIKTEREAWHAPQLS